jgi:hypothetical protein
MPYCVICKSGRGTHFRAVPRHLRAFVRDARVPAAKKCRANQCCNKCRVSLGHTSTTSVVLPTTTAYGPSTLRGAGKGLFATRHVAKGAFVTKYGGRRVLKDDARKWQPLRMQAFLKSISQSRWAIDGRVGFDRETERGRYINQAPVGVRANVRFAEMSKRRTRREMEEDQRDRVQIGIFATRDIATGEELFISYGNKQLKTRACEIAMDARSQ